jgi:large subunit ribosomal protein L25
MATSNTLNVLIRERGGRSASRRLRKNNQIPAILYGKHCEPSKLTVDAREFKRLLKAISGHKTIIELQRPGVDTPALSFLQEVQRDPITDIYLHADFQEIRPDEKFEVEVPTVVKGECHGVKYQNGILEVATHSVRVRCLAKDLPGAIIVDISNLNVDQTIKVRDLPVLDGVEYRDSVGQTIVACLKGEKEEEVVAPAAAAPGKKK